MNKPFWAILIILALTLSFVIFHASHAVKRSIDIDVARLQARINETMNLMVLSVAVVISYVIFMLKMTLSIPTPHVAFLLLAAYTWGCISYYSDILILCADIMHVSAKELGYVYVSVVMFSVGFLVDLSIFMKTLPQILVISIPVGLATGSIFGAVTKVMVAPTWPDSVAFMFGTMAIPTYSKTVALILQQETLKTRQLNILLEGEAIFTFILADVVHELVSGSIAGVAPKWYQVVFLLIRFIGVGGIAGYVMGYMCAVLMQKMSDDKSSVYIVVSVAPFFIFSVSNVYISGCGSIPVMVAGLFLAKERLSLDREVEQFLTDVAQFSGFMMNVVLVLVSGLYCAIHVVPTLRWQVFFLSFLLLVTFYAVRFICYLIFLPIISRLGYGMDFKNMLICVIGGLRSSYCIQLVLIFATESLSGEAAHEFFFYMVTLYFLSNFINGSLLRNMLEYLAITRVSLSRQANMDNCMRHVLDKRERTMAILKMERFLCDAEWPIVRKCTLIQHPYYTELRSEDDDTVSALKKFTYCPDCQRNIAQEPSGKALKELTREAKMRILKAKQMSYARKFSSGMMSKDCIRILSQAIELAMDSEEATIEVEDLHRRFTEEDTFWRFIRKGCEQLRIRHQKNLKKFKPPMTYWRRVCYHMIVTSRNRRFDKIMLGIIVLHLVVMLVFMSYHPTLWKANEDKFVESVFLHYTLISAKFIFVVIYVVEFMIRVLAYSYKTIWDGVRMYFKSIFRIIDFTVILVCLLNSIVLIIRETSEGAHHRLVRFQQVMDGLGGLRAVRLLRGFYIFYPSIMNRLDERADHQLAFTYELGKTYTAGENEILDVLPHMIDNPKILQEIRHKIESDRVLITKLLGMVQKDRPWISITVKTIQAIRTVLGSMKQAMVQLKATGWMDNFEREKLQAGMGVLYRNISYIKVVQPSSPKEIFKEVAWMAGDERVVDFLFENVTVRTFDPGEIVFTEGDVADGIYIVVTGLFELNYEPDENVLENLHKFGQLPIVDYISGAQYQDSCTDYIVCGNCIGELSVLTERPYNCRIISNVPSQVYVLRRAVMKRAMEMNPDPVRGLQCRIWKEVSIRIAVPILISIPVYQAFSPDQVQYVLERAFLPDLSLYDIFYVTDLIEDILLIEGVVADYNTRETLVAPCAIPRTVQKLILPKSNLMKISTNIHTKLLVIPSTDVEDYDVMMLEEEKSGISHSNMSSQFFLQPISSRSRSRRKGFVLRASRQSPIKVRRFGEEDSLSLSSEGSSVKSGGSLFYRNINYADTTSTVLMPFFDEESLASELGQKLLASPAILRRIESSSSEMPQEEKEDEETVETSFEDVSYKKV